MQPERDETRAKPRRLPSFIQQLGPSRSHKDLVLPPSSKAQLREALDALKAKVARPQSPTLVLFTGANGTGKTMAAQIIGRDLGMDVFRIDLTAVVSKYIGETEKNLASIFAEAERQNAILFFDEADALFGKRSGTKDMHSRYVDRAARYIVRKLERHKGVFILATNRPGDINTAFVRRIRFVVDFPFPDTEECERNWAGA